jgi:transposase
VVRRNKKTKDLSVRSYVCPDCGTEHDRDVNAARNIVFRGLRLFKSPVGHGLKALRLDAQVMSSNDKIYGLPSP